jgi:malic enzyme
MNEMANGNHIRLEVPQSKTELNYVMMLRKSHFPVFYKPTVKEPVQKYERQDVKVEHQGNRPRREGQPPALAKRGGKASRGSGRKMEREQIPHSPKVLFVGNKPRLGATH